MVNKNKGKTMKKIIGLSCGRKNGNSEFLLKEAAMGAEELGVETEIIRAAELTVKPCTNFQFCAMIIRRVLQSACYFELHHTDLLIYRLTRQHSFDYAPPVVERTTPSNTSIFIKHTITNRQDLVYYVL
jgi:hypothetical protein